MKADKRNNLNKRSEFVSKSVVKGADRQIAARLKKVTRGVQVGSHMNKKLN